ncbi:MAG: HPF/RaiA family ribosome-associated protein [Actinomycetia bacterium]|nr:HPF/RaiA family ribosome-associated protein [Actinomycetes bacterium]
MSQTPMDSSKVRLGGGFTERDRLLISDTFSQLLARIESSDRLWELELSVKDREAPGQHVTLEAWVPGKDRLVATSSEEDLRDALNDVAADVLRQFNRARERNTPRANRQKRDSIRGSA